MDEIYSGFHLRIQHIIAQWPSETAFAKAAGLSQSGLNRIIRKKGYPTLPVLIAIAKAAQVSVEWLATGTHFIHDDACNGELKDNEANIEYDNEYIAPEFIQPVDPSIHAKGQTVSALSLSRKWIEQTLKLEPAHLKLVKISGDAMEHTLFNGDIVLVNCNVKDGIDGIYALKQDNIPIVRRVQFLPGKITHIFSENNAYQKLSLIHI